MTYRLIRYALLILVLAPWLSCDDLKEPVPTAHSPVPPPPPSQFDITGHWQASSDQGRSIAFDVTESGQVINGRINLHHDCNTGRWRVTLDNFEAQIVDESFLATYNWKNDENGIIREGTMTVSGRFESNRLVKGAFINSVNDVRNNDQPTGEVCPAVEGTFEGNKQ